MKALLILAGLVGLGLLYWFWSKGNVVRPTSYTTATIDPLVDATISRTWNGVPASSLPFKNNAATPSWNRPATNVVSVETLSPTSVTKNGRMGLGGGF